MTMHVLKLLFYCRVQNNGKTDTIAPVFIYTNDPHANIVRHTPANAYLASVSNSVENDDKLYIQSTPGSYATVKVPGLDTFSLTNRVIHRAELIVEKFASAQENFYTVPNTLFIDVINDAGDSAFTVRNDFIRSSSAPGYDVASLGGRFKDDKYVFNLSRYVQSLVTKKFPNSTLRIYAPFSTIPLYARQYQPGRCSDRSNS